jgi:ATP-dependent DNA helicase RecG
LTKFIGFGGDGFGKITNFAGCYHRKTIVTMNENEILIKHLQTCTEFQMFDRKSVRIEPKALATTMIAFANADGGQFAIGIEDDGSITGIDGHEAHVNELLRANLDFCVPSVSIDTKYIECEDVNHQPNHILLLTVHQSTKLHTNQADEVFYRVGDKSKKLNFEQRLQLMYAKGSEYYEDTPVKWATIDDLDLDYVQGYLNKIGYTRDPLTFLRGNSKYVFTRQGEECVSVAAILLFGKDPQQFFPRAQVRFIRYDGDEERFGKQMNIVKDVTFRGRILEMTQDAIAFFRVQMKEHSFLGDDGYFVTIPEYPETCWLELLVNAVAHRDYSIRGTGIDFKIFDHSILVESPGILPGLVRAYNIREIHCSRNPKIMMYLHEYGLVKDLGEGVNRMFIDMEKAKQPIPEYRQVEFMLKVRAKSAFEGEGVSQEEMHQEKEEMHQGNQESNQEPDQGNQESNQEKWEQKQNEILKFCEIPRTAQNIMDMLKISNQSVNRKRYIAPLVEKGLLVMTIPSNPTDRNQKYQRKQLTENQDPQA